MKVKDLIQKLNQVDENLEVWFSANEENDRASYVEVVTDIEEEPYSKGNTPNELGQELPYLLLL